MKTFIFTLLLTLLAACSTQPGPGKNSSSLSLAQPASVGISEVRLARIDSMLAQSVNEKEIPGAVALIARHGKIVFFKAYGTADAGTGREFKTDNIFRIASQTKAVTATAVMILWEEGKFQLDDPIAKYIPEFDNPQVLVSLNEADSSYTTRPAASPVTIRELLTHTSGIGYGFIDSDPSFTKIYQKAGITDAFTTKLVLLADNIKKLAKLPLHFDPGTKYSYSEGLDVLGYFVEIMSGMPLDTFFRTRIFNPLGMDDTWFYLPNSKAARLVPVQTWQDDKWVRFSSDPFYDPEYPVKGAKSYFAGGAGLCSTAQDYATFLQMYLNQGQLNGKRLLSRTTVEFILSNQIGDLMNDRGDYYGLVFGGENEKAQNLGGKGHAGTFQWGGYFNTQYFADPKEQIIGILMKQTQNIPSDNTGWKFRQMVETTIDD